MNSLFEILPSSLDCDKVSLIAFLITHGNSFWQELFLEGGRGHLYGWPDCRIQQRIRGYDYFKHSAERIFAATDVVKETPIDPENHALEDQLSQGWSKKHSFELHIT